MLFNHLVPLLSLFLLQGTAQEIPPPWPPKNQTNKWTLRDVVLQRFARLTPPNVGSLFTLTRTRYVACPGEPGEALLAPGASCGWISSALPVQCSSWGALGVEGIRSEPTNVWSPCQTYLHAAEGEESIPDDRRERLKWRIFDLEEAILPIYNASGPPPFRSLKIQIVNVIQTASGEQSSPDAPNHSTTGRVRTLNATFTITQDMVGGIDRAPPGACFWDADNGGPKNSSRYQCGVGGEGLQNPKVVCHSNWNGHAYNCDFEVDVVDQSMSVSEFKMRYW